MVVEDRRRRRPRARPGRAASRVWAWRRWLSLPPTFSRSCVADLGDGQAEQLAQQPQQLGAAVRLHLRLEHVAAGDRELRLAERGGEADAGPARPCRPRPRPAPPAGRSRGCRSAPRWSARRARLGRHRPAQRVQSRTRCRSTRCVPSRVIVDRLSSRSAAPLKVSSRRRRTAAPRRERCLARSRRRFAAARVGVPVHLQLGPGRADHGRRVGIAANAARRRRGCSAPSATAAAWRAGVGSASRSRCSASRWPR